MVLLSITPLLDGVLRLDIIAPFHTSGPPLLQFHLAIEQWGYSNSTGVTFPIAFKECYAVVSNAHSNTTGNTDHYHLLSWTSTGAAFGYWNMSFYGTLYIALGVEYSGEKS